MGIVIDRLQADREMYLLQQEELPPRVAVATSLRDAFGGPAIQATGFALTSINSANSLKSQIVVIGGNTGLNTARYGTSTANITSQYGSVVSSVGSTQANLLGIVGLGSDVIAYGIVKVDQAKVYDYPKISGGDYSSDYPFTGEGFVNLTSSNLGAGVSTRLFQSNGSEIGKVFDIIGPAVDVSSLVSQYNSTWSIAEGQATSSTSAQRAKGDYELQVWGLNRQLEENTEKLVEIEEAIGIASSPIYGGPW
jgi:rRNA processing protein Gar1